MDNLLHYYFAPKGITRRLLACDLCIYGGNASGVIAAVSAARLGLDVILIEPSRHLGGMTASGLGMTDFGNKSAVGGVALEFYRRVGGHYGVDVEWRFEPHVAKKVFEEMLAETSVRVFKGEFLDRIVKTHRRGVPIVESLLSEGGLEVKARMFMDCTYEGDLMAMAGVSYFVGREGNAIYGETLNGQQIRPKNQFDYPVDPYRVEGVVESGLLAGIEPDHDYQQGVGDERVQAYNFRMCLTQRDDIRIPFPKPVGYASSDYDLLARYLRAGWDEIFRKFDKIRNGKTDTNNHGAISTNLVGGSHAWPEGNYREREVIFQRHVVWQQGFQWFMANDSRVPSHVRRAMASWGLCRDEFCETRGWPHQLYIREGRRMVSDYVITEADCRWERVSDLSIGLGAYNMDSHNCRRIVLNGRTWNEGDVQVPVRAPYGIDYRAIVPRKAECGNLFVPVCVSASHIAYGSIRMEPVFMVLGHSAAVAAALALAEGCFVQDVPYHSLSVQLLAEGQQLRFSQAPVGGNVGAW